MYVTLHHRYLLLPSSCEARYVSVQITQGSGAFVDKIYVQLCMPQEAQRWFHIDLQDWIGRELHIALSASDSSWTKQEGRVTALEELARALRFSDAPEQDGENFLRPSIHYTAHRGWINDPNGLCWYGGKYHLYYQTSPCALEGIWDNCHWGHAYSDDLFHWQEVAPAVRQYASSGTSFIRQSDQRLCICYQDILAASEDGGYHFTEFVHRGMGKDPKIFYHERTGKYIAVDFNAGQGSLSRYVITSSPDLYTWREESQLSGWFECPELFEVPIEGTNQTKWILHSGDAAYRIGFFDGSEFIPDEIDAARPDFYVPVHPRGVDIPIDKYNGIRGNQNEPDIWRRLMVYAMQVFTNTPDNRTLRMGWYRIDYAREGMPFNQCMCVAQEVMLRDTVFGLRLCVQPVREIARLYGEPLQGNHIHAIGTAFDIHVQLLPGELLVINQLRLLRKDDTALVIQQADEPAFDISIEAESLAVRAILDVGCVEVFFDKGEVYLPLRANPHIKMLEAHLYGAGRLTAYPLVMG